MGTRTIRKAADSDLDELLQIKESHERHLYGHQYPVFRGENQAMTEAGNLSDFLAAPSFSVDVMEEDGELLAYIVSGSDPDEEGTGLIYESSALPSCDILSRNELITHILRILAEKGMRQVHIWLAYDNFRTRFLYEQLGFHRDSHEKTVSSGENQVLIVRYTHMMKI